VEADVGDLGLRLWQADRDRRGVEITLQPPGPLVGSSPDLRRAFVAHGKGRLAIIGARPKSLDRDESAGSREDGRWTGIEAAGQRPWWSGWRPCARDAIWLADTDGQPIGKVDLRGLAPEGETLSAAAVWDDPGTRLAACVSTEATTYVGLVDLESFTFDPVAVVDDVGRGAPGVPTLLWGKGELVFCYQSKNSRLEAENVVLCVEPSTGEVREVLRELRWDPSRRPMHAASLSPDGRYLAFDRALSPTLIAAGGTCAGIWVLDLESGERVELTYEYASRYQHQLVQWDDADTLLFACRVPGPSQTPGGIRYDLYRAHIDFPLEEAPTRVRVAERRGEHGLTATGATRPLARPLNARSDSHGRRSSTRRE
jgi:hypothetical protein